MIAFVRLRNHRSEGLHLVEADGSHLRKLELDMPLSDPAWSPDGRTMVAVGRSEGSENPAEPQLHLVSLDGSRTRITGDGSMKLRPTWSADGTEVVFERAVGRSGYHLFAVRRDGSGLRQLTGPPVAEPGPPRTSSP